jgi:hypothetical protein
VVKGEGTVGVVVLIGAGGRLWLALASGVSNLVIARPLGTPLAFLFFEVGPVDGEVCRDRVRGVTVVEVTCDGWEDAISEAFWNCMLRFCMACKSALRGEALDDAPPAGPDIL